MKKGNVEKETRNRNLIRVGVSYVQKTDVTRSNYDGAVSERA